MSSDPEAIIYYGFPLPDFDEDRDYHDINKHAGIERKVSDGKGQRFECYSERVSHSR